MSLRLKPDDPDGRLPETDDLLRHVEQQMFGLENPGWCLACGDWTHDGCEPDARFYPCPVCSCRAVWGAEELMIWTVA